MGIVVTPGWPIRPTKMQWWVLIGASVLALISPLWIVVAPDPGPPRWLIFPTTVVLLVACTWVMWPLLSPSRRR